MKIVNSVNLKPLNYNVSKSTKNIEKINVTNINKTIDSGHKDQNVEMVNLNTNSSLIDEIKNFFFRNWFINFINIWS